MSQYGRLWEECREIREELKQLVPGASTESIHMARKSVDDHFKRVQDLLAYWENLERKMGDAD